MFVRSTGLGRTLLRGRISILETTTLVPSTLEPPAPGTTEPMRILMAMEILHPVHWTVRAFLDPADLREMVGMVLKNPMLILRGIKFLFSKGPVYEALETAEAPAAAKAGPGPIPVAKGPGAIPSR